MLKIIVNDTANVCGTLKHCYLNPVFISLLVFLQENHFFLSQSGHKMGKNSPFFTLSQKITLAKINSM